MKYIKISLFIFLVLVSFNNSIFGSDAKIYLKYQVIKKDSIFYDKKSNSKIDGVVKWYYTSGVLEREALYKDGKKNGVEKWYYKSGGLESNGLYKDGKLNGVEKWYYESGVLKLETLYKDGKKNGVSKGYYK